MIQQLQLLQTVRLYRCKVPAFLKAQVNFLGSMIFDEWARIYTRYVKRPLTIAFLGQRSRVKNGLRGPIGLGVVEQQRKSSSDKSYLNILRAEDVR